MVQDALLADPVKVKPCNVIIFTPDIDEDPVNFTIVVTAVALT